jgi:hypothetical protein
MPVSAKPFAAKKFAAVRGRSMAYIDEGAGDAIRAAAWRPGNAGKYQFVLFLFASRTNAASSVLKRVASS